MEENSHGVDLKHSAFGIAETIITKLIKEIIKSNLDEIIDWNNKEVVMSIVKKNGKKLKLASKKLRNDPDVVLAALKKGRNALNYGSKELRANKKFILNAINSDKDGGSLYYASKELKNDYDVIEAAINRNGANIFYASEQLKNNKNLALLALLNNAYIFDYLGEDLRNEIGNQNPMEYLKNYISLKKLSDTLENELPRNKLTSQRKLKL